MITLATLENATEQEVFNQVKDHLLNQNEKSLRGTACAYRSETGLMCAAGCLMSDEEAEDIPENTCWWTLVSYESVPLAHAALISKLQQIHDSHPCSYWPELLEDLADGSLHRRVCSLEDDLAAKKADLERLLVVNDKLCQNNKVRGLQEKLLRRDMKKDGSDRVEEVEHSKALVSRQENVNKRLLDRIRDLEERNSGLYDKLMSYL